MLDDALHAVARGNDRRGRLRARLAADAEKHLGRLRVGKKTAFVRPAFQKGYAALAPLAADPVDAAARVAAALTAGDADGEKRGHVQTLDARIGARRRVARAHGRERVKAHGHEPINAVQPDAVRVE